MTPRVSDSLDFGSTFPPRIFSEMLSAASSSTVLSEGSSFESCRDKRMASSKPDCSSVVFVPESVAKFEEEVSNSDDFAESS